MVVDPKTLNNGIFKYNIGSNVLNKLTGQQAQTPVQQPTNTPITQTTGTQGLQQQPETYKVITNKFPTYDIKDMMGAGSMKNQISFMQSVGNYNRLQAQADANTNPNVRYNLTKPQLTNKQTLQIQQATPETNEQGLKINKTNSFKDLVIDLQNVANQGRSLEFMKFRELYPEYVENWDKVVDLFESIKSNPQYSAEQVTTTAQKAYPELFGIDDGYSNQDKTTALKKLYDEMVSNKQNGIQLTQQDIIDRYPEYANTEDINTVMEVQNLMNRDRKNTPTFNDIYENFESLIKGDTEIGNTEKSTMKKDIDKINNMSQSTYEHLSEEGKKYVQYLATAKEIADYVKEQYYTTASDVEIVESLKNNDPDLYNEIFGDLDIQANLSEEDRKLLDEGYTIGAGKSWWEQVKHSATEKLAGLGRQMQNRAGTEWKGEDEGGWHPQPVNGQREDGTYERNPLMREDGTLETNPVKIREIKMAGNNYQQRVRMQEYRGKNPGMDKIDYKIGEFLFGLGEEIQRAGEKATAKIESSQNWKDIAELNKTSFWDALKKGDVKTMLSKSTAALGQSTIDMGLGALTGDPLLAFGSMYAGSYERAMQDIESDENLKGMTREEKERAARLMAGVESVIEEASMSVMMPGVFGGEGALSKLLPSFNNALLKGIVQTELGAASEGGEEVLQEFFNNLITQSYGSDRELGDLQDYWNIFSETFLSSQLMSVIGGTKEGVQQAQINQIQNEIKKQGELRNTVLEGQALISEDFNDFAQRVEEVPGTTTEELQQVWNNAQQKKQDLEQKANNITSNSYNNVNVPTYERTTVKDTVKPKITANESQQYTDLLDEMVKNKEISEDDRKRVEKTLGVFTLNTKEEQDNKIGQQTQTSGLANINQNSDKNNGEKSNIISRGQNQLVQNYNRMNPKAINDFKKQFKQDYGKFLVDRGFTKAGESNLEDLVQYADTLLKLKDKALEPMQGRYQDRSLEDMLEMVVERARNTKDYAKLEEYEKLLQKYNEGGIEVSEILSMMRWFNNKIKTGFFKEQNSEKLELATNVYMATRNFLDKTAKENGMESLDKINREIRAVEHIIGGITYKLQGSSANNMLGLNDYIALGATLVNPEAFAFALTKLALKKESVRNMVLRLAVGKRGNSKNRISEEKLNDELNRINAIADQKKRDAAIKEFNEKYGLDGTALPYKEGYNGTPTTTITVTPEGLSKTQGNVNTPNSEQKSQGLSETQKNSETENNTNEEVQDSIQDFLVGVGANETKQDLGNITTADYKNMSRRGLEQLLESDKIPAEEAKKITEELDGRKVKEESNEEGWGYLDHYYAYKINQLQEEEQRIGKVGNKKVNKSYAEEQMKAWEKKKEKLKEDMKQDYGDKDNNRVEDKYGELESKPIDYINEWTKSKRFVVDEAEQQVIAKLQENWNKINRFELNMTEEEKKVREDILGKVSDLYETKSTDYGDSFVSRTNRDNRGIIYRDDGRVNVNSLDTLKSSGLYDVLPDDTKITISGQEQTTLGELKNTKPSENKIVDKNGKPKNVYHYSDTDFDTFDFSKMKNKLGAYFSPSSRPTSKLRKYKITANIDMKNPLTISPTNKSSQIYPELQPLRSDDDAFDAKFRELLKRDGYDGVIMLDDKGNVTQYVVLDPEQITVKNKQALHPENNGLADINVDKEAEAQVEGLAKINEQIAKEEQNKKTIEEGEKATLKEKAEAQKTIDNEIADEQNDIVKEIDQKVLNDMEFSIQELNDLKKGFEETEKQGLAAISVKVENGKVVKESEVDTDRKEQAKIARDNYKQETKGMNKSEKIARVKDIINTLNELSNRLAGTKNSGPTIEKLQMQVDEFNNILSELEGNNKTTEGMANIAKEIKVENGKIETVKSDSDMINEIKDDVINNMKKPRQKSILGKPVYYQYLHRDGEIEINKTSGSQFGNYYNIILKDPSGLKASYILAENDGNWTIRKIGKQDLAGEDLKQFYDTYFGKVKSKEVGSQKVEVVGDINDPIREFKRNNQDDEHIDEVLNKETTWTDYDTGIKYVGTKAQEIQRKVDNLIGMGGKVEFRNDSYGMTMTANLGLGGSKAQFLYNLTEFNYAKFLYDNPQIRQEGPKAKGLKEAIEEKKNSIVEEQKNAATEGTKEINPDNVLWQQNTYKEGVDKVYGVLKQTFDDFLQVAFYSDFLKNYPTTQEMADYRTSNGERIGVVKARIADVMYNKLGFKSNKSKEFVDLNTNIAETKGNEAKLRAIANTLYIDRVRKDIKEGYNYPQEVIDSVPGLRTAQDNYERYLKGRDTSFSSKDARIDYSEQDILGAGTKRQDGKQITEAQRKEIVDGVTEYQEVMGIDMKKMAEDIGLVYVHLNGKHPFLTARAVGVFHPGYNSISVGAGRENYREKDGKNMTTHTADIVMAHEITHAIDSIFDWNLFSEELIDSIRYKMTNYRHASAYWKSKEEVTARMVEEYVSVMKGSEGYFDMNYYWNKEDFNNYVKPAVEKIFNEKFADYKIDKTKAPKKVGGKDIAEIKADAITRGLAEISNF